VRTISQTLSAPLRQHGITKNAREARHPRPGYSSLLCSEGAYRGHVPG
jgi:hypothetical protein